MKKIIIILFVLGAFFSANAQWSTDPNVNQSISKLRIYDVEQHVHTNGDVYFAYYSPSAEGIKTYLQILDKNGVKKLGENGILISAKETRSWTSVNDLSIVDQEGNAIIAVQDMRNDGGSGFKKVSYSAYKISPTGEFLWGADGVDLSKGMSYREDNCMRILQVGSQYMFVWSRWASRNNASSTEAPQSMKAGEFEPIELSALLATAENETDYIVMERLDKDGKFVGETQYLKDNTISYKYPWIHNAGNGQVILVYAKGTNQDLMARKLDFDGSSVWAQDATIYRGGFGTIPIWTFVTTYEDPEGGVFACWHDDRDFTNIESAYISYIKADGTYGYAAGIEGQKIGFSGFRQFRPTMTYNSSDKSTHLTWVENTANQTWARLCAQRLTKEGDLMWNVEGVEITPFQRNALGYTSCQMGNQNQMAVFFMTQDSLQIYGKTKAFASLLGADGKFVWKSKLALLSSPESDKGDLTSTQMVDNQWITSWSDSRGTTTSTESCLWGQNIQEDGSLGTGVSNEMLLKSSENGFHVYPNPMSSEAHFLVEVPQAGNVNLTIYNNLGQKVSTLFNGKLAAGAHEFSWNENMSKGMYVAVLNNNGKISNLKIIRQ